MPARERYLATAEADGKCERHFFVGIARSVVCSETARVRNAQDLTRREDAKKPPRMRRRGGPFRFAEGSSTNLLHEPHLWRCMQNGRPKAAVFIGNGAAVAKIIVSRRHCL
jgi:hypothetical protein